MRFYLFIFSQIAVCSFVLLFFMGLVVLGGFAKLDWTRITWFEVIICSLLVLGAVLHLYRLAFYVCWGRLVRRDLIVLQLPSSVDIDLPLKGYSEAEFVIFSRLAKLSWLRGKISVSQAGGKILKQLLLNLSNEPLDDTVKSNTRNINAGGKGSGPDYVDALFVRRIDPSNPDIRVHFELDWNSEGGQYRKLNEMPEDKKIAIELFVRAVRHPTLLGRMERLFVG